MTAASPKSAPAWEPGTYYIHCRQLNMFKSGFSRCHSWCIPLLGSSPVFCLFQEAGLVLESSLQLCLACSRGTPWFYYLGREDPSNLDSFLGVSEAILSCLLLKQLFTAYGTFLQNGVFLCGRKLIQHYMMMYQKAFIGSILHKLNINAV